MWVTEISGAALCFDPESHCPTMPGVSKLGCHQSVLQDNVLRLGPGNGKHCFPHLGRNLQRDHTWGR